MLNPANEREKENMAICAGGAEHWERSFQQNHGVLAGPSSSHACECDSHIILSEHHDICYWRVLHEWHNWVPPSTGVLAMLAARPPEKDMMMLEEPRGFAEDAENKQNLQQVIETAMVADHYTPGLVEDVLIIVLRTSTLVQWDLTYCT